MRRRLKNKKIVEADLVYNSPRLAKFINYIMLDGKKETARGVVYGALDIIKEKAAKEKRKRGKEMQLFVTLVLQQKFVHAVLVEQTTKFLVKFVQNEDNLLLSDG